MSTFDRADGYIYMGGETNERSPLGEFAAGSRRPVAIEWPTLILIVVVFAGWLATTYAYTLLPLWVVIPLGVLLITLHGSLQHEMVHGHPHPWQDGNRRL